MLNFNPRGPAGPFLPFFFSEEDPRPAREQFHSAYAHGGGFHPFEGFELVNDQLLYPGDPPLQCLSKAKLRDETIMLFQFSWLCIVQPDGSYVVARAD